MRDRRMSRTQAPEQLSLNLTHYKIKDPGFGKAPVQQEAGSSDPV